MTDMSRNRSFSYSITVSLIFFIHCHCRDQQSVIIIYNKITKVVNILHASNVTNSNI